MRRPTLEKVRTLQRTTVGGLHVGFDVYTEHWTVDDPGAYLARLDEVYEAMQDLVDDVPFGGAPNIVLEDATMNYALVAGQPILLAPGDVVTGPGLSQTVNQRGIDFGVPHEFWATTSTSNRARTSTWETRPSPRWGVLGQPQGPVRLRRARRVAPSGQSRSVQAGSPVEPGGTAVRRLLGPEVGRRRAACVHGLAVARRRPSPSGGNANDVYLALVYTVQQQVGWEPFKCAFREYARMPAPPVPATDVDKVELFANTLSQCAGVNLVPTFQSWGFPIQATHLPADGHVRRPRRAEPGPGRAVPRRASSTGAAGSGGTPAPGEACTTKSVSFTGARPDQRHLHLPRPPAPGHRCKAYNGGGGAHHGDPGLRRPAHQDARASAAGQVATISTGWTGTCTHASR